MAFLAALSAISGLAGAGAPAGPVGPSASSETGDNFVSSGAKVFNIGSGGNPNAGLVFGGPQGNQLLSLGTDPTSTTAAISRNIVPLALVLFGGMFLLKLTRRK